MNADILVTGGAGFIGSHVMRTLHEAGRSVVCLDVRPPDTDFLASLGSFVVGDLRDPDVVARLLRPGRIRTVVHIGGVKSVEESIRDPGTYFDVNTVGTLRLVEAMARAGVLNLIFSSSAAVYGAPDELPLTEGSPTRPENPYGESKLLAERALPWYARAHGIRSISLRYFNAAGASLDSRLGERLKPAANLIPMVMQVALGLADAVRIFGTDYPTPDGTAVRDYIHVLDLADAHLKAVGRLEAEHDSPPASEQLNLGTGRGASVAEVINTVADVAGRPLKVVHAERRPGDPAAVWADNAAARERLGWEPRYELEDIVATAWRWYTRDRSPGGGEDEHPQGA